MTNGELSCPGCGARIYQTDDTCVECGTDLHPTPVREDDEHPARKLDVWGAVSGWGLLAVGVLGLALLLTLFTFGLPHRAADVGTSPYDLQPSYGPYLYAPQNLETKAQREAREADPDHTVLRRALVEGTMAEQAARSREGRQGSQQDRTTTD